MKKIIIIFFTFFLINLFLLVADDFEYQFRGNRYEGILPSPDSGGIELISVLSDYQGRIKYDLIEIPQDLKIKFFLKEICEVYITVRELDYNKYYWLDKIKPDKAWETGFGNEFSWPTKSVVKPLDIEITTLGVLVKLEQEKSLSEQYIAPVIFYHSGIDVPKKITGYIFHFQCPDDAILNWTIVDCSTGKSIKKASKQPPGGTSFSIKWDAEDIAPGKYKLVIEGYLEFNKEPVNMIIIFYHEPVVK